MKTAIIIFTICLLTIAFPSCKKEVNITDNNNNDTSKTILPLIISDTVLSISRTGAVFSAKINSQGLATTYHFEYGASNAYGDTTVERSIGSGSIDVVVKDSVSTLLPATLYHFRLVASNANGKTEGFDKTFTTPNVILPLITFSQSRDLTTNSANLEAFITPNGKNGTYCFEYGETISYGMKTPEQTFSPFSFFVTNTVYSLTYGTQYHWRTHLRVDSGEVLSNDGAFTTLNLNNPVEFSYPLTIGATLTYAYHLTEEDVISGSTPPSEERRGTRIWKIESQSVSNDSTIYNILCTANDTVLTRVQYNMPPDTSYDNESIPFTILFTENYIYIGFDKIVKFANGARSNPIVPLPRIVESGTKNYQCGDVLYVNGVGLKSYSAGFFSNTGGYLEQLTLQ